MLDFAGIPEQERADNIEEAAYVLGVNNAIIEKDFWICWTLNYLFEHNEFKDRYSFKGGTSLSKGYHLIERMSEDIDLILDWRLLGYGIDEPWEKRSNTKQDAFIGDANSRLAGFLKQRLMPQMEKDFGSLLRSDFTIYIDDNDSQTLCFDYPRSFDGGGILQQIRLETGALAAWTPASLIPVTPYIAEALPLLFIKPSTFVLTVAPERTFWEKVTILHREAFRTNGRVPSRYSRHYYDIYKLSRSSAKEKAFASLELLRKVVEFKMRFYRMNSARYDLALAPQTIKLMPPAEALPLLKGDYQAMQSMIFGDRPAFDEILVAIAALESEINSLT
jgi:hypothetical protein